MNKLFGLVLLGTLWLGSVLGFEQAADLDDAKILATKLDKPIFIDFTSQYCGSCLRFERDMKKDKQLIAALEQVILVKIDTDQEEGQTLFLSYGLYAFPSFLLTDSEGRFYDSFIGYNEPTEFITLLNKALSDPELIEVRKARFERQPNSEDALILANHHATLNEPEPTLAYYQALEKLDQDLMDQYRYPIFQAKAKIARSNPEAFEEALKAAERVMAMDNTMEKIYVTKTAASLAKRYNRHEIMADYTRRGLALTEGLTDPDSRDTRYYHDMNKALLIDEDLMAAFQLKKSRLGDSWESESAQLNRLAWWCFENKVNLQEARQMAEKSVLTAENAEYKAAALDTLAEILNELGDPAGAAASIRKAIAEYPASDHYPKQLKRFQGLVEKKTGS